MTRRTLQVRSFYYTCARHLIWSRAKSNLFKDNKLCTSWTIVISSIIFLSSFFTSLIPLALPPSLPLSLWRESSNADSLCSSGQASYGKGPRRERETQGSRPRKIALLSRQVRAAGEKERRPLCRRQGNNFQSSAYREYDFGFRYVNPFSCFFPIKLFVFIVIYRHTLWRMIKSIELWIHI